MKCPFCDFDSTKVVETRESGEEITRRRRECSKCSKRFTTYERVELHPLVIIKKNGVRETFDRNKLRAGFTRACEKRPISVDQINIMLDEIESQLRNGEKSEVKSHLVGSLVMKKLKKLDKVAYIRFASVYMSFQDLDAFEKELKKLQKTRGN